MEEERKKAEDEAKRRMVEERRAFAEARKSMVNFSDWEFTRHVHHYFHFILPQEVIGLLNVKP